MEKKYKGAVAESEKWHSVAVKALKAGNEDDAKAALQNEGEAKAKAENLKTAYLESKDAADKVKDALNKLQAKIDSMETRKESIKAKATTARIKEREQLLLILVLHLILVQHLTEWRRKQIRCWLPLRLLRTLTQLRTSRKSLTRTC